MNIPVLNTYQNNYVNGDYAAAKQQEVQKKEKTSGQTKSNIDNSLVLKNPDILITKKERDFFIKMFPENSEQLSKHIVFNKNGKLQTHSYSKGLIVDGRA